MSIINDAIKKARKDSDMKEERHVPILTETSGQKSRPKAVTLLILLGLLLVFIILSKLMPNAEVAPTKSSVDSVSSKTVSSITSTLPPQKSIVSSFRIGQSNDMELSGIVCGREDKWALINNKIFREGDTLLDGAVTLISKDSVKIEKNNGEEIVLRMLK